MRTLGITGTPAEMFRPPTFANAIFHIVILGGVVYPFSRWGGGLLVPFSGFGGSYPPFKALGVVKPHFGVWRALLCIFHNQKMHFYVIYYLVKF